MTLTLTNDEARNLVALIDLALKHPQAGGVAVVVPAVALLRKVEEAQRTPAPPPPTATSTRD